ncbi:MAG: hypothetical protein EOL95_01640 [Bacteroidia bacterium]|nr:hypothetical protein [Bacteroidia bacterium]
MIYLFTVVLLLASLYIYFPIAQKYRLLAGVNNRSSHKKPVITGAGFIFYLSYLVYFIHLIWRGDQIPIWLFIGLTILAVISFMDDLSDVWFLFRLVAQGLAASALLWQLKCDFYIDIQASVSQWLAACFLLILAVGSFNLYNFMDGLNGMLGGLALSMVLPALLIDLYVVDFIDNILLYFIIIPTIIFLFFNYRKQPKCFSGDVGSIVIGYLMVYIVLSLLIKTGNVVYIFFFTVVYIEAGLTVLQRLFAGENIFKPHRIHLFQLLCNEHKKSHLLISAIYVGIQFVIGIGLFLMNYYDVPRMYQNIIIWPIFTGLAFCYLWYKRKRMGGHLLEYNENTTNIKEHFKKNKKVKL